ncbi:hypothetical protein [Anaeromyxobacter oryzae]|uniref:Cytochrome c n=1 Tax=Anaeromyxobacter oryzae TaxID=2918170 RepID=A0ABM7X4V1_9BACT|nr:hypothetical protein [Anaeromyxobacter oryzae]BDG06847.1 cytochrome c [Anaeromyxobacter oryzae]
MKKVLVAMAAVAFATSASATIKGGSHDLSSTGPGAYGVSTLSSCQFCHAPHNANIGIAGTPLWNRKAPVGNGGGSFTVYTSTTLSPQTVTLGANSLTCLSCHDGVSDMGDTFVGSRGFAANTPMHTTFMGGGAGSPVVGTNLNDDHPVGVVYPATATGFVARASVTGVKLYASSGGNFTVECGSCHDPHGEWDGKSGSGTGLASFLRVNANVICSNCHDK